MAAGRGIVAGVVAMVAVASLSVDAQKKPHAEVSLKVSQETGPPGAIVQLKILITEPRPITTGSSSVRGIDRVAGIALGDPLSAGIAVVREGEIAFTVVSPSGSFGTIPDYPLITIAGYIPDDALLGTSTPVTVDPGSVVLTSPEGTVYPVEIKDGLLQVAPSVTIHDVVPGSAALQAGEVVSIFGGEFRPDSKVRLKETQLQQVQILNPGRVDVVLAEPTLMHGKGIRIKNRDGSEVTYFSYQRTSSAGTSGHPALRDVVPLFLLAQSQAATVPVGTTTVGLALQNPGDTETVAGLTFVDATGGPVAYGWMVIPPGRYAVRSLEEVFGLLQLGTGSIQVAAQTPVQVLGVDVDGAGTVTARLPQ